MNNDIHISVLEWDSNFFDFPIARINQRKIMKSDSAAINSFCTKNNIRLLQFQCEVNDSESILAAESMGFHFADYRVNYTMQISGEILSNIEFPEGFFIDYAAKADILNLQEIAGNIYQDSRYYFDKNFPRSKVEDFYKNWIAKSVLGLFDDYVLVLYYNSIAIGFICIVVEGDSARFSLVGMLKEYAGKGLGTKLLHKVIGILKSQGIKSINTITQGRNISAQNFYNRAGFNIKFVEIYYHYWIG
jgi:dTDP-4-amino-4,6-dideoxy-D-galactose acyltransferase